ncbi:MAG: hypothetical protein NC080_07555 [Paraprevotella sp.]|nr:hypothetical protein [Paraprevotella sp.]
MNVWFKVLEKSVLPGNSKTGRGGKSVEQVLREAAFMLDDYANVLDALDGTLPIKGSQLSKEVGRIKRIKVALRKIIKEGMKK